MFTADPMPTDWVRDTADSIDVSEREGVRTRFISLIHLSRDSSVFLLCQSESGTSAPENSLSSKRFYSHSDES